MNCLKEIVWAKAPNKRKDKKFECRVDFCDINISDNNKYIKMMQR